MKNKNFDDFSSRKDTRRKHLSNKFLNKRSKNDDDESGGKKSSIRRQRQEMSADEIWEDWEEEYDS